MPGLNRFFCRGVCAAGLGVLGSCATYEPSVPPSQGHITAPEAPAKDIPPPVKSPAFVPPPKPVEKLPTYSVVVTDVPAKELLFALSRDTKTNIDIHPGIQGLVTLNAINETLPGILDRIARQIDMRYRQEGTTLIVEPDTPYFRTYRINYLNLDRQTKSVNSVATQISSTGGGTTATGGAATTQIGGTGGTSSGNTSSTTVESESRNNFFSVLERNIQTILASTRALKQSADQRAAQAETIRQARGERVQQVEAASRAGAAAPALFNSAFGAPPSTIPPEVINEVSVNPLSGTVSVLATERQHQLIQQHIDTIMGAVTRQVLIEATIVEVRLFNNYQAGIDFSLIADGAGFSFSQVLRGAQLDNPPVTIGYSDPQASIGNISVLIRLLEQFGKARVLSSPRLMALNNQTALLKVVDNRVFFNIQADTVTNQTTTVTTFNTTINTVPVGLVMTVTPQINENKEVILTVRPTVSRIINFVNDPNPDLARAGVTNPVPEIQA
ncbi:MAG TPA: secretin N-terminal domain-containing protein, partial [Burkholderiales bacterium]|nr:secretin N-terminal domain-containing protein [Burkholderiales bacterium]